MEPIEETAPPVQLAEPDPSRPSFWETSGFVFVLLGVLGATLALALKYRHIYSIGYVHPQVFPFPPFKEIKQNLDLMLQGYFGGYWRTIYGVLNFTLMSVTLLWTGSKIYWLIFKYKAQGLSVEVNALEKIAIFYALGSLAGSLFWLLLGLVGLLKPPIGFAVLVGGSAAAFWKARSSGYLARAFFLKQVEGAKSGWKGLPWTEKGLIPLLIILVLAFAGPAVWLQQQNDALFSHAALPFIYVYQGRVAFNPFHYYSYFYQNTEMLAMWPFLTSSDVAAQLLIWGFFAALLLWTAGFLARRFGTRAAVLSLFVLLSAPALGHSVMSLKNDVSLALFLSAHYFALIEALGSRRRSPDLAKRWMILAGILGGGAVGHKMLAIPLMFFSSLWVGFEDVSRSRNPERVFLSFYWFPALALPVLPWALRSWAGTGNPIYPFLSDFFHSHLGDAWTRQVESTFGYIAQDAATLRQFLRSLLMGNQLTSDPDWGPALIFLLPAAWVCFSKRFEDGVRGSLGCAFAGILSLLYRSVEIRFFIGLFAFATAIGFSAWHKRLEAGRRVRALALLAVLGSFFQVFYILMLWLLLRSWSMALSGNNQGNYPMLEPYTGQVYWMSHLINTRTPREDGVLLAGVKYLYGFKRRLWTSSYANKEILYDWAEKADGPGALKELLRQRGVRHILIGQPFLDSFNGALPGALPMDPGVLRKIEAFLSQETVFRASSPDGSISWYSFREDSPPGVLLGRMNALEFPLLFLDQASALMNAGHYDAAQHMIQTALETPMRVANRFIAYDLLAQCDQAQGRTSDAEQALKFAIGIAPNHASGYLNLARFYNSLGPDHRVLAMQSYRHGLRLDPGRSDGWNNLGVIYFEMGELGKARECFERALAAAPFYAEAWNNLGNVQFKNGDYRGALALYQKALEFQPTHSNAANNVGLVLLRSGSPQGALEWLERAAALDPTNANAHENLAELYKALGRPAQAQPHLDWLKNRKARNPTTGLERR